MNAALVGFLKDAGLEDGFNAVLGAKDSFKGRGM